MSGLQVSAAIAITAYKCKVFGDISVKLSRCSLGGKEGGMEEGGREGRKEGRGRKGKEGRRKGRRKGKGRKEGRENNDNVPLSA